MRTNLKSYPPCNIYDSAIIGDDVSIGAFCEIGDGVVIGDGTRIGAMSFIPAGVTIGRQCFIGPRCTCTNDMYPPSPTKEQWQKTVIMDGAALGAAVTVIPGVTIGRDALIGAGSVVVCDIPDGETWAGNPARVVRRKEA